MNRFARFSILGVSILVFGWVGLGHVLGRTTDNKAYKSLVVYSEVLQKIQQDYVDEPNMHLVEAGSLHGLLESLDSESSYFTPREYAEYKQKIANSATAETGLNLSKRFGYIIVTSVIPDSSADKAGIRSGDIFESVAGFTTREMSVGQAKNLLAGPSGTSVKVGVIRRGKTQPESVDLSREKLPPSKLQILRIDNETIAIRFPTLEAGRADEVRAKLQEFSKQGVTKVILDLRECGRGSIPEALSIARLLVPSGNLTSSAWPDRSGASLRSRWQQGHLERPRVDSHGRHHDGSCGNSGGIYRQHQARRSGGRPHLRTCFRAEAHHPG